MKLKHERRRFIGGVESKEATSDLMIRVTDEDVAKAHQSVKDKSLTPKDAEWHHQCAIAQACHNLLGSDLRYTSIMLNIAYIDLFDDKTKKHIRYRYIVPPETRELVEKFDEGGQPQAGLYIFKAPTPGQTRDAKIKRNHRDKVRREAIMRGEIEPRKNPNAGKRGKELSLHRHGTGTVSMHVEDIANG